jgi:hypothetical protein
MAWEAVGERSVREVTVRKECQSSCESAKSMIFVQSLHQSRGLLPGSPEKGLVVPEGMG